MRFRFLSGAALLVAVPGLSVALGLGDETVRSYLNAPLNAEIELFATPDELNTLQVKLASREDFARHGLDYPGFLTGIQVRAERLADGRNVIRLTSSQPIVEPFVVLLVDVRSSGSRVLREYTLLLDPPTFQPQPAPAPPVAAPTVGDTPLAIVRPPESQSPPAARSAPVQPAPAPAPPPVASAPAGPAGGGGRYVVQRGDTLSRIATREFGAGDAQRGMIAIYRANPQAFGGNINLLQAGATLQIPDAATVAAISPAEALAEVRAQMATWRQSMPAPAAEVEARLRLVPPGGPGGATGRTGSGSGEAVSEGAGSPAAPATAERPLAVESPDLARLQGQAVGQPGESAAPASGETVVEGEAAAGEATVTEPPPVTPEAPAAEQARAPAASPPADETTSGGLLDMLRAYWFIPAGILAVLLAVLALVAVRRRREAATAFVPLVASLDEPPPLQRDSALDTFPLRKPADSRNSNIVVEESGAHERTGTFRRETQTVDLDEGTSTTSTMGAAALEQGDPMAEADFHMAYGLYDQAADIVKAALDREPERRDLKLKLLEVYFVWGNKEQFLQTARDLARTRHAAPPGEWEKVIIMGKQLAPEDVLFHHTASVAPQTSVDLNLEGGQNLVDFDLPLPAADAGADLDVNLNTETVQPLDDGSLDIMLEDLADGGDGAPTATTRQMAQPGLDAITAPTVEQPALDIDDTLAGKLDAQASFTGSQDQTAELSLDNLGLDVGELESTGTGMPPPDSDEVAPDTPTLVAGLDQTSRELLASADASQRTEVLPVTDLDLGGAGLDIDFSTGDTGRAPTLDANSELDLHIGDPQEVESAAGGDSQQTQHLDSSSLDDTQVDGDIQRELEPVTMSEVGTKLDLARAYMDMGDPDGARSILNEVLQEGSEAQRKEARRLLDSIPG
jgi:pilus assembly protein FimV